MACLAVRGAACNRVLPPSSSSRNHACPLRVASQRSSPSKLVNAKSRKLTVSPRAESRSSDGGFAAGFLVGSVLFGALGFIFAPQISKALLGDDNRLRMPRFLEDEQKDPEQTRQDLFEKIAQLNSSIDEVSAQLKAKDDGFLRQEPETMKIA